MGIVSVLNGSIRSKVSGGMRIDTAGELAILNQLFLTHGFGYCVLIPIVGQLTKAMKKD
jgi:hypothetical protein